MPERSNQRKAILLALMIVLLGAGCNGASSDSEAAAASDLGEAVEELEVAAEAAANSYDRDVFGDYDRDTLLESSMDEYDCYRSRYDDECYDDSGEVHVDHRVALAEAWRSGASEWPDSRLDEFAADKANLVLMTAGVNTSKSDDDVTDWLPEHDMCHYVEAWVEVKLDYDLSADQDEKDALLETAADCS